jgi:hypothetical protein
MIFEREPTFNERKAFVGAFRHKWMREMNLTSVFDRLKSYKQLSSKEIISVEKIKKPI